MLHLNFYQKLFILFLSFLFFYTFLEKKKEIICDLFNFQIIQSFFFQFLRFEEFVSGMRPLLKYTFLFSLGFNLGAWPSYTNDPSFYYLLFFFFYGFYYRLKMIFLDPSFLGSVYSSLSSEKETNFTWNTIIVNMSSVCSRLFGKPITNQLGGEAGKKTFPQIYRRYVFSRNFQGVKANPELATITTAFGGMLVLGISEFNQKKRTQAVVTQANILAKQANDLKEIEIDIQKVQQGLLSRDSFLKLYPNKSFPKAMEDSKINCSVSCSLEETFSSNWLFPLYNVVTNILILFF